MLVRLGAVAPGVMGCLLLALSASVLAAWTSGPVFLFALLLGMACLRLGQHPRAVAGVDFCAGTVLRFGVALLGARVSLQEAASLGWGTIAMVCTAVSSTIAVGAALARRLGLPAWQGLLSGGATAICGASAALALSAALPRSESKDRFTLAVVAGVTTLSTLAMLVYPLLARALLDTPQQAGFFIGGAIHDVAQVVAAGFTLSDETGRYATIVKLLRVSLLVVAVAALALHSRRVDRRQSAAPFVPVFLVGFLVLAAANSFGLLAPRWLGAADSVSRAALVTAVAALGLRTSVSHLRAAGWRCLLLLAVETLWIAIFALAAAWVI